MHATGPKHEAMRVLLFPRGWDASPLQDYPQQYHDVTDTHFIHLGGERQCGVKFLVEGNNTMAGLGLEPPTFRSEVQRAKHYTTAPPQFKIKCLRKETSTNNCYQTCIC